jgi:hypothetical protein
MTKRKNLYWFKDDELWDEIHEIGCLMHEMQLALDLLEDLQLAIFSKHYQHLIEELRKRMEKVYDCYERVMGVLKASDP